MGRRSFLRSAIATGTAAAFTPASIFAANPAVGRKVGPNEKLNLACVGNRGAGVVQSLLGAIGWVC